MARLRHCLNSMCLLSSVPCNDNIDAVRLTTMDLYRVLQLDLCGVDCLHGLVGPLFELQQQLPLRGVDLRFQWLLLRSPGEHGVLRRN
jgi:hypothetical protein